MVPVFQRSIHASSSAPKRDRAASERSHLRIRPAEEPVLRALAAYHLLTAEQLTRLLYARGSRSYVKATLKRLGDAGYCEHYKLPRRTERGNLPYIYRLSRRGQRFLIDELGLDLGARTRPARIGSYTYVRFEHLVLLNDLLIAITLQCHAHPRLSLAALRHDEDLRQAPVSVMLTDGRRGQVVLDGWVDVRVAEHDGVFQECFAVELDRGTEHKRAWQAKIAQLIAFAGGPYQSVFGTEALAFLIVTTAGGRRMEQLITWTAETLQQHGRQELAAQLLVTGYPTAQLPPADLLTAAIWRQPFAPGVVPAIRLEGGV